MPETALRVSDLTVVYGDDTVLDLQSLEFERGKIHIVVGPNGAGKTTLLRVIAGLEQPATGSVEVFGCDLYRLPRKERLRTMRRMTFCFQKPYLFNSTVRANVEYGLRFRETERVARAGRVQSAMKALSVLTLQERNARTLSAGETQRVSLARALVLQPELVLLDEPVANVDQANRSQVETAITELQAQGCTVVVATHQVEQAYRLSANVVRLERGRIAPPALENLLEGEIVERDGSAVLLLGGGLSIHLITEKRGFTRAAVDPANIIVSKEPIRSSARNSFAGRVAALSELDRKVVLSVDVGLELTAHITRESFEGLGITLGSQVYLTFKASSVTVF